MAKFIPIILGTGREGNKSQLVARFIMKKMQSSEIETKVITPAEVLERNFTARLGKEISSPNEKELNYQKDIMKSDAIVIVSPEYNRSFPGELKLLLDLLYPEYKGKKFFIVGVSDGPIGGARAVDSLLHVVVGLEGVPIKPNLFFTNVLEIFDESGEIKDEKFTERVEKFVKSL